MEELKAKYDNLLNAVGKIASLGDLTSDGDGLVSLKIDGAYILNLQLLQDSESILCFVELMKITDEETSGAIFRELLSGNLFGRDTNGGYFGLETETMTVVYHYTVKLDQVEDSPETLVGVLESILALCDLWTERIKALPAKDAAAADDRPISILSQTV